MKITENEQLFLIIKLNKIFLFNSFKRYKQNLNFFKYNMTYLKLMN